MTVLMHEHWVEVKLVFERHLAMKALSASSLQPIRAALTAIRKQTRVVFIVNHSLTKVLDLHRYSQFCTLLRSQANL